MTNTAKQRGERSTPVLDLELVSDAEILARELLVAQIRRHRETHPTAAEDARSRWELKQKELHCCNYIDVGGVGVCTTHDSAPPKRERE